MAFSGGWSVAELLTPAVERSRKAFAGVLQRLQGHGVQKQLAVALGVSESTVSRIKSDHMEDCLLMLYQLGFKLVDFESVLVDAKELQTLKANTVRLYQYEASHGALGREEE